MPSPIWSQPWDGIGFLDASQNDTNGGFGSFALCYDNFKFGTNQTIGRVTWTGGFFNPNFHANITQWRVGFWTDNAGQPGTSIHIDLLPGNGNETFLESVPDPSNPSNPPVPVYNYSADVTPFAATAGVQYWVSVQPDVGFPPQWGWGEVANGQGSGDGIAYQDLFGTRSQLPYDLAFALWTVGSFPPPPPADQGQRVIRYNINTESWDTLATPVYGAGAIHSMDSAVGQRALFAGALGGQIINRDPTVFQDSGVSYTCSATLGPVILSPTGEDAAAIENIAVASAAVGVKPTISVLRNEITGTFTQIPDNSVADPPLIPASTSVNMFRHYWLGVQSALANVLKFIQVKFDFTAEATPDEIFSVGLIPPKRK